MWKRVERIMRGNFLNKVDRETRFTNKFDQFVAEPGEALVSVYNRFAQLMNNLERNDMHFLIVTINIKFLNSLQSEWLKYVTQVRLTKRLTVDTFDDLFDYLQQFKKLVNASRAKKLEKSHDPLALVAHTGSSSRNTSSYYMTHPTSVVDYEDEYQQDDVHTNSEDPLASAMLLLARPITQKFSTPTNNRLRTSSNTINQAIIQGDRVNIQSMNYGNAGRNNRRAYVQEEIDEAGVILTDEHNDFLFAGALRMKEIKELSANICLMARIQPADNTSDVGPSYESAFISEVQSSSNNENEEQMYPTHTKIINNTISDDQIDSDIIFDSPNGNVNSGNIKKDTHVPDLCALEQLARNAYQEAEKQQIFAQKVQKQNMTLTYIIRDLEKQRDKLDLDVKDYKRKNKELQKTHSILKRQMSENEDRYHDRPFCMLYDRQLKHGLEYPNPYTLKQAISQCPKLYLASSLGNSEISLNVRDTEDTLDDASKSQQKRDIKEMKDVFESTESELCELEKQNDFLKDQLLEVSLKHEVELSVLLNHECVDNSLHAKIEQLKKKSIEIQEVSKPKIDVRSTSKANDKVSSTKKRNLQDKSLSTYMKNKIQTSQIWQKWFESKPNVVWSPVNTKPNGQNSRSSEKQSVSVKKWVVKLPTCPCGVSSCVTGSTDRSVDC
ncbi:hypothetical protein Tco_0522349 [Tanacetum coccineum]